jgi:hypothetical protein
MSLSLTHSRSQAKAKEAKKEAKIAKQLEEEQLRSLLNEGISNQFGKKKTQAQSTASKLGIAEGDIAVSLPVTKIAVKLIWNLLCCSY